MEQGAQLVCESIGKPEPQFPSDWTVLHTKFSGCRSNAVIPEFPHGNGAGKGIALGSAFICWHLRCNPDYPGPSIAVLFQKP